MLESGAFLQYYGTSGGGPIGNMLARWDSAGVFDFVLPFLMIFALVFTVMESLPLFGKSKKGVNTVIALAVSLMSLQFGFVSQFFSQIFPTFGAILGVLLLVVILFGFIGDPDHPIQKWSIFIFALIAVAFVVFKSFSVSTYFGGGGDLSQIWFFISANFWNIIGVLALVGLIVWIISPNMESEMEEPHSVMYWPWPRSEKKKKKNS